MAKKAFQLISVVAGSLMSNRKSNEEPIQVKTKILNLVLVRKTPTDVGNQTVHVGNSTVVLPPSSFLLENLPKNSSFIDTQVRQHSAKTVSLWRFICWFSGGRQYTFIKVNPYVRAKIITLTFIQGVVDWTLTPTPISYLVTQHLLLFGFHENKTAILVAILAFWIADLFQFSSNYNWE